MYGEIVIDQRNVIMIYEKNKVLEADKYFKILIRFWKRNIEHHKINQNEFCKEFIRDVDWLSGWLLSVSKLLKNISMDIAEMAKKQDENVHSDLCHGYACEVVARYFMKGMKRAKFLDV